MPRASSQNKRVEQQLLLDAGIDRLQSFEDLFEFATIHHSEIRQKIIYMQWKQLLAKVSVGVTIAIPEANGSEKERASCHPIVTGQKKRGYP
jgi:hypothetical protein